MASTSPYQQNDYQAVSNYRPYELPINDIYKAIDAQNRFWDAGAAKVKNVYENALGLELTLDDNNEVRKDFMAKAEKEMIKLSGMDLSDPSVQRQGFGIFRPLLRDKAIMYDNELTKVKNSIFSTAEEYKRKKLSSTGPEGEGYTQRNMAYALDGFEEFNSKTPRDANTLKDLYGKLGNKAYTPYYNPKQEYEGILKLCKGSSAESQGVASNYLYFNSQSKVGASSSEAANCFMEGLSDKAKEQIGIDGWAYYKMNPHLLVTDHHNYAIGPQQSALNAINGKLASYRDIPNPTAEEKAVIKKLEGMIPDLTKALADKEKEYTGMVGGDADKYIKDNFNQITAGIYLSKEYLDLGEAFKSDKVSNKVTSNASGIVQFNTINKSISEENQRNHEFAVLRQKYLYDIKVKQAAGEIPMDNVTMFHPKVTEGVNTGQDYNEQSFNNDKEQVSKVFKESFNSLKGYILSKDPNAKVDDAFLLNYVNEQSKLPEEKRSVRFSELMTIYNKSKEEISALDIRQKSINAIVDNTLSEEDKQKLREITILSDGTRISAGQIQSTLTPYIGGGETAGWMEYTINGNVISPSHPDYNKLENLRYKHEKVAINAQKQRDALYKKSHYDAQGFTTPRIDPKKYAGGDAEQMIQNTLGVRTGEDGKTGYKLLGHDENGQNLIVIALDGDGNEKDPDLARATAYERNVKVVNWGGRKALQIPYKLSEVPDLPTPTQKSQINHLREWHTLMEGALTNKGSYTTSEDLKNSDGSSFAYPNYSFETPSGGKVKVTAVRSNSQTKLVPSRQRLDGSWNDNYPSFSTPEEVILHFRGDKPNQ